MYLIGFLGNQIPPYMKNTLLYSITEVSLLCLRLVSSVIINHPTENWLMVLVWNFLFYQCF